jgi:hypothetical protein
MGCAACVSAEARQQLELAPSEGVYGVHEDRYVCETFTRRISTGSDGLEEEEALAGMEIDRS